MNTPTNVDMFTPFRVGDWTVYPNSGLFIKGDEEVKIEPKVMEVLVYLAQHRDDVVSREALEANIWTGTIVGYDAVSGSIIKLRKAFSDDSRNPRYIKTVSKRGYQLIAAVSTDNNLAGPEARSSGTPEIASSNNEKKIKQSAVILGVILIVGILLHLSRPDLSIQPGDKIGNPLSVVVLPFKNLSDNSGQEHLSDGITDDLITDLSRNGSLRVIARQSSYYYKNNPAVLEEIAKRLNVLYIVEGSVRILGQQIRINVQLTDTKKRESIWAQRFDTDTGNVFKVQDDITANLIHAMLEGSIETPQNSAGKRQTYNFRAYDAFLVGLQHIEARDKQGYELATEAFQHALEIDPGYARAYGALAVTLTRGYRYQWTDLSLVEARERALELANKAIELNNTTPQIYWAVSYVHLHRREYDEAEEAARQSVTLSPNYADGYALLANIANWRGKPLEAIKYVKKAAELNPHYTFQYPSTLGLADYILGRYQEAVVSLKESLTRNESALNPRLLLAATYTRLHQPDDAAWEITQIRTNRPDVKLSNLDTLLPFEDKQYLEALKRDLQSTGLPD